MEDIELVEDILNGNIDSFEVLMKKYEISVLRFIYKIVNDKEVSEDIAQEVFITVYNKLESYNKSYKFSTWIFQIAKNKTIDYIRKYKKVQESDIDEFVFIKDESISPEDTVQAKETIKEIQDYINNLNDMDRKIIVLRYKNNYTFDEISKCMNINVSLVKRRYYKIKEEFKNNNGYKKRGVNCEM